MNLEDIRQRILENLDDVDGDVYAPTASADRYGRIDSYIKGAMSFLAIAIEKSDPDYFTEIVIRSTSKNQPVDDSHNIVSEVLIANDVLRVIAVDRFVANENVIEGVGGGLTFTGLHPITLIQQQRIGYYLYDKDVGYIRQGRELIGETNPVGGFHLNETIPENWPAATGSLPEKLHDDTATFLGIINEGNGTYRIVYSRDPVANVSFSSGANIPGIPVGHHDLLVIGATLRALLSENSDVRQWQSLWNEGMALLQQAIPSQEGVRA